MRGDNIQNEAELCALVKAYLEADDWTVYQEVHRSYTCDLVAKKGGVIWCIEAKMQASFELLEQGFRWIPRANLVSLAVPESRGSTAFETVCRKFGLGLIRATKARNAAGWVSCHMGEFRRHKIDWKLQERERTHCEAGGKSPQYWSPFKATLESLRFVVAQHPEGIMLGEAVKLSKHHYGRDSTAIRCLAQFARQGVLKGIEYDAGWVWIAGKRPAGLPAGKMPRSENEKKQAQLQLT